MQDVLNTRHIAKIEEIEQQNKQQPDFDAGENY
jgi:hypothetical protein